MTVVGVDVGGTKLLTVVSKNDAIVAIDKEATPADPAALVDRLAALAVSHEADALGVGCAGAVTADGTVRYSPNLPAVRDLPLARLLSESVGIPVAVNNDATCALRAEHACGAARDVDDALLVTVGTGLGGGILLDGRIMAGAHGFAGEIGHMVVVVNGEPCPCGRRGCWERYASGVALGAATDADFERVGWWLASGLVDLDQVLDVERIVLSGGVAEAGHRLLDPVRRAWSAHAVGGVHRPAPEIVLGELGERAGAIGAGLLAASL